MRIIINTTFALLTVLFSIGASAAVAPLADPVSPPVKRVATLEYLQTEIALALGIEPIAATDPKGYRRWVGARAARLDGARDLGTRQEPDLEGLIAAEPDLIVGAWWRSGSIADRLQEIAPTLLYDGLPDAADSDQYARMRAIVRDLGERTGRGDATDKILGRLDARLDDQRARLADADLSGTPVILAQSVPGTTRLRLFTDNSLAVRIAEAVGLRNAWSGDGNAFGFDTVDLKRLAEIENAHMLWVTDPDAPVIEKLRASRLWQALPVVNAGRVHPLPEDTWFFGGPLSAMRLAERLVDTLAGTASSGQVAQ